VIFKPEGDVYAGLIVLASARVLAKTETSASQKFIENGY
jgi:hypothetical protein